MDVKEFCEKNKIRAKCKLIENNPNMVGDMPKGSRHFKVRLIRGPREKKSLTTYFSMGPALTGEPTADKVLNCLKLDALSIENSSNFEEWCDQFGVSSDSISYLKAYNACSKLRDKLEKFLEPDLYEYFLYQVEDM